MFRNVLREENRNFAQEDMFDSSTDSSSTICCTFSQRCWALRRRDSSADRHDLQNEQQVKCRKFCFTGVPLKMCKSTLVFNDAICSDLFRFFCRMKEVARPKYE